MGEAYAPDALKLEKPFEDQGVVVAQLEDGNVVVDNGTGIRRSRRAGESPGTPQGISGAEPGHAPAGEEAAYLSDIKARQKNLQGPEAGLGGINRVVVTAPQSG